MPVIDGKHVSWQRLAQEQAAAEAEAPTPAPVTQLEPEDAPKPKRRTRRSAVKAIKDATGVTVNLEA